MSKKLKKNTTKPFLVLNTNYWRKKPNAKHDTTTTPDSLFLEALTRGTTYKNNLMFSKQRLYKSAMVSTLAENYFLNFTVEALF